MQYPLNALYRAVGVSKQAVHQAKSRQVAFDLELAELVALADLLKAEHPGCGVEKMYYTLKPETMGRDTFCELFMGLGYGVQRVKNYQRTTYRGAKIYPNLIEGMAVSRSFQVIQSDITYFYLNQRHYYLVFIIDVYTKLIVGYAVNEHLRAQANLSALKQALKLMNYPTWGLIHHSDRGAQYSSTAYTQCLSKHHIHISMGTLAYQNAYAERINGIIKNEYLKRWVIKDYKDLKSKLSKAVKHYNMKRKHRAFKMKYTPMQFYQSLVDLPAREWPIVMIYTQQNRQSSGVLNPFKGSTQKHTVSHFCPITNFTK
jgi:putative transposase